MDKVRIGIVGLGNMGSAHAKDITGGTVKRCELAAVCDLNPAQLAKLPESAKRFSDSRAMIRSGLIDAVIVATPHYSHTTIGVDALENGIHLLVEKPISVHKKDCEKLIAAHGRNKKLIFAAMFNQRTDPLFKKMKQLVQNGDIGRIQRVNWVVTDWFRSNFYYASGGWRATWAGEGGGVLLNQCPHNLDLLQWICGKPSKIRAFCAISKYHKIEVEDEFTAYMEYPDGATSVMISSTGEAPGTNRFEIAGDNGRLIMENNKLSFIRNEIPTSKFNKTTRELFSRPEVWNVDIPIRGKYGAHPEVTQNFVNVILDGGELIARGEEGIHSVEMANAMLYSSMSGTTVDLPLNGEVYEAFLKKLIRKSKFVKKTVKAGPATDMSKSWR